LVAFYSLSDEEIKGGRFIRPTTAMTKYKSLAGASPDRAIDAHRGRLLNNLSLFASLSHRLLVGYAATRSSTQITVNWQAAAPVATIEKA
jgi:hypothetical protein